MYTVEFYLATKKKGIMTPAGKWTELEIVMLSELSQTQKDKYVFFQMQNLRLTVYKYVHICNMHLCKHV